MCSLVQVYCRTCQRCICAICVLEEHRTHKTVSVQTETRKQKHVARTEQEILNRIREKELHVTELKRKLEAVKSYAEGERGEVDQLLDHLSSALDRVRTQVGGLVRRLEAELSQLTDRRATLEDQAVSQDHILFLQSYEEATSPLGEEQRGEEEPDFSLHFQLGEVKSSLLEVKEKMEDIRMGEVRPRGSGSAGELMMAESLLSLRGSSASLRKSQWSLKDLKKMKPVSGHKKARVYMGEKLQFYRNSQQRFDVWSCISGKESFSTGRHYWEGLFDMSPSNGYYAIWWSNSTLRALTAPPLTKVKSPQKLRQVGVFLDMDEGQVSFFNVKTSTEIYSFSGEFSDRMFPLLGTGDKEVPLVLMSTQHQLT
ncbi:E3 ubiquitin-protein ligase TRIM39 [Dissostichus eleginoides]|uniref:E3 ubiquitin-protein ligase TRIM39 n=1 Tax=Dissostichus eleginoides TaxID=100907 RepID=A0AAD9B6D0_DISEL|nr:E3 ubiquitin-protein ligase TRIM39 [Dissostichus eleginoides]